MVLKARKNNFQEANDSIVEIQGKVINSDVKNLPLTALTDGKQADITELNPYLEGLDGIGDTNRVVVDGTEFEYKNSERRVKELNIQIFGGRKVFQYWDDNKSLCQSFDGKVSTDGLVCATCDHKKSKSCKFKFEIRWTEINPETEEPEEMIMTLATVSSINFVKYIKDLAKLNPPAGVHEVLTHMAIERRLNTNNSSKYSAVVFKNQGLLKNMEEKEIE